MFPFNIEAVRTSQIFEPLRCRNVLDRDNGTSLYLVSFQRGNDTNQASAQESPFGGRSFMAYLVNAPALSPAASAICP